MRQLLVALAFAVAAVAFVLAGTTDDGVPDKKYLEYAKGFAPYTAKLKAACNGKVCEATATLISDHWALTAAHVVEGSDSATLIVGDKSWEVVRIVRHPQFEANGMGVNDLAMLHTPESFGLDYYPPLSDGDEKPGDIVSVCGYGVHGKMSAGHGEYDGKLRAGTNHIERLERSMLICSAKPRQSSLELCIAPGDSGGPLFCKGKLAGVNCVTMAPKGPLKSRAGEESGHVQVSLYREWIDGVMEGKE
jgi:hypothetical protein